MTGQNSPKPPWLQKAYIIISLKLLYELWNKVGSVSVSEQVEAVGKMLLALKLKIHTSNPVGGILFDPVKNDRQSLNVAVFPLSYSTPPKRHQASWIAHTGILAHLPTPPRNQKRVFCSIIRSDEPLSKNTQCSRRFISFSAKNHRDSPVALVVNIIILHYLQ